uniref:Uncharacterized protein n=1 Tax=Oryza barthii TaxID=65489 RepID=A0A0D3GMM8_9ORYZ
MQHLQGGNGARKRRCRRSWETRQGFRLRLPQSVEPLRNQSQSESSHRHRTLEAPARPKSPNKDRLNHKHSRTLLLNYRKAPRPGGGGQKKGGAQRSERSRGRHEEDLKAEVRGNKDHVVFHESGEELRPLQDISYDCSNHHQLYHQCREGDTGESRRSTKGGRDVRRGRRWGGMNSYR